MTRMDILKSDCHLHLKYMMGLLQLNVVNKRRNKTEEKVRWYVQLEPAHLMYNPHPYALNHQGLTADAD